MQEDMVIPLFTLQWSTRAVYEGVVERYQPRKLHIIAPSATARALTEAVSQEGWDLGAWAVHDEDTFFVESAGVTKADLAGQLRLGESLYPAGWYYQQLLKLGAHDGIAGLSEAYLVWDSDLLPVDAWPAFAEDGRRAFALLQDNSRGNADIVGRWSRWIEEVLSVAAVADARGTFVPHHMWFDRTHLEPFKQRVLEQVGSEGPGGWAGAMMESANRYGTFSEFWAYASWVAAHAPGDLAYFPYEQYGQTTERFFEDGTAPFATKLRGFLGLASSDPLRPDYAELISFIDTAYEPDARPSSLSFEASPRHRKKGRANMHVEELRSRWHTAEDAPA